MKIVAPLLVCAILNGCISEVTPTPATKQQAPVFSPDAHWPWSGTTPTEMAKGILHWRPTSHDGSVIDLVRFDFKTNPNLCFGLYDQDQDDSEPMDNRVDYFPLGVGRVVHRLNNQDRQVLAAWNGLFFAYDRGPGSPANGWATHIGPVVLHGKPYFNVGRHRWTFGVKQHEGLPEFKALFTPNRAQLSSEFDFAADGAQLLIRSGAPLRIQAFEESIQGTRPKDTERDAGAIPMVDWMKTSRMSMAWSEDRRYFWLLSIRESGSEVGSKLATKYGQADESGWTLKDLQSFWLSLGVWGAVNSDGGVVAQFALRNPDGSYEVAPSQLSSAKGRIQLKDLSQAPDGGSLLTFYIYSAPR